MSEEGDIGEVWRRIEAVLAQKAPRVLATLAAPALPDEIAWAEEALGTPFPMEFAQSMSIHDGQTAEVPLAGSFVLLPCREIVHQWRIWEELWARGDFAGRVAVAEGPVRPQWWNRLWIPVTQDGSGDHHCLDLDPPPGGRHGQLISLWHDSGRRIVVAEGFPRWLVEVARSWEEPKEDS